MRTQPLGLASLILCAVCAAYGAACGSSSDGNTTPNEACDDPTSPDLPRGAQTAIRGSIIVRDKKDFTLDDSGKPMSLTQGRITATFADFSTVTSTPSALMLLGSSCLGVVSRPVSSGQAQRLDVATLEVRDTAIGVVQATRTSTGVFSATEARLVIPGASEMRVVAQESLGGFPGFDEAIGGLAPMELTAPKSDGKALLNPDDLDIEWTAGDGEYVLISIVPQFPQGMGGGGGQVLCTAEDDGCFVLPAGASTFLLASRTPTYTLSVERHRHRVAAPRADVEVEIEAIWETRVTLENGVLAP